MGPSEAPPPAPAEGEDLSVRRRIFRIIASSPGIHVREVERRAGVAYGAVSYHLRRLEEDGLVRAAESGQLKTYFSAEFPREERALAAAIRAQPARGIFVALLSFGELAHGDLAQATGLGASTLSWHTKRLAARGFLAVRQEGRRTLFSLTNSKAVERAVIRHGHSVGDAALDAYITVWTEWRRPGSKAPP